MNVRKPHIDIVDPKVALAEFIAANGGTQDTAAEALGVSQAYVSDMLAGRRNISPSILAKLGLQAVVVRRNRR